MVADAGCSTGGIGVPARFVVISFDRIRILSLVLIVASGFSVQAQTAVPDSSITAPGGNDEVPDTTETTSLWQRLWKSPRAISRENVEKQRYKQLATDTANAQWSAVDAFRSGDYEGAATGFADSDETTSAYNRATALAHAGQYDEAIAQYDEVLQRQPEHEKARHNRDIVNQLKQQQENQQNQQGENQDSGESQESSENQQNDSEQSQQQGEQDQEQQSGQQGEQGEEQDQTGQEQSDGEENSQTEEESAQEGSETDEQWEPDQQNPDDAVSMQESRDEASEELRQMEVQETPMTESEQATEQWLRKIPDDPSGLLRRKLERSHAGDYRNIGNNVEPW